MNFETYKISLQNFLIFERKFLSWYILKFWKNVRLQLVVCKTWFLMSCFLTNSVSVYLQPKYQCSGHFHR